MYYSLSMQQTGGDGMPSIELLAKVDSYLSLLMTLIFAFGICFQTPVILTILARVGFIDSAFLKRQRRYAIVIIFCIAAVLAPARRLLDARPRPPDADPLRGQHHRGQP